jgi:hypothetical protein
LGIVTKAAAAVGMSREIHYYWLKNDAGYREGADNQPIITISANI